MNKLIVILALPALLALPLAAMPDMPAQAPAAASPQAAAALTQSQDQFLAQYENVRAALARDDLPAAQKAAATITAQPAAAQLARAKDLDSARAAFKTLSAAAVTLAKGHPGYFVAYCPMADSDWVQTSRQISNPYLGKAMPGCGTIQP